VDFAVHLVLFDVDGTLVDSQAMIVAAMSAAFAAHGRVAPPRERVLSIVGLSLETAMRALLPEEPHELAGPLADAYKAAFQQLRASPEHHEPLFEGALDVLDALGARDDLILGLATGKSQRGVRAVLDLHDLHGRFVTIQTADTNPSKPHPGMIQAAAAEAGVLPQQVIMIGDTTYDMEMAGAAGAHGVGVRWGYHEAAALQAAGATVLLDRFDELPGALERILVEKESA